jgi:predicted Fe-S protein YdhL (DUF1289 family)
MANSETPYKPMLSPCIGICHLGADGLCEGCHRTTEEIARWMLYTDDQRLHMMDNVLPRRVDAHRS